MAASEPAQQKRSRKYIIAVDESKHSANALQWALENVLNPNDELTILNVYETEPIVSIAAFNGHSITDLNVQLDEQTKKASEELVKGIAKQCEARGIKAYPKSIKGDAKHTIVELVNQQLPCALLISSRGMSGMERFFLGSVSDYCVHSCKTPVIVIRTSPAQEGASHKKST